MSDEAVANQDIEWFMAVPTYIADDPTCSDLVDMYNEFGRRLRDEIKGLPLKALQLMLLERTLTNYLVLRWRERTPIGAPDGFEHTSAAKDFQSFWLMCHKELNTQMRLSDTDFQAAYDQRVTEAINRGLEGVPEDVAALVRQQLHNQFVKADL